MDDAKSPEHDNKAQPHSRSIVSLLDRLRLARSAFRPLVGGDSFPTAFREARGTIDPRIDLEL